MSTPIYLPDDRQQSCDNSHIQTDTMNIPRDRDLMRMSYTRQKSAPENERESRKLLDPNTIRDFERLVQKFNDRFDNNITDASNKNDSPVDNTNNDIPNYIHNQVSDIHVLKHPNLQNDTCLKSTVYVQKDAGAEVNPNGIDEKLNHPVRQYKRRHIRDQIEDDGSCEELRMRLIGPQASPCGFYSNENYNAPTNVSCPTNPPVSVYTVTNKRRNRRKKLINSNSYQDRSNVLNQERQPMDRCTEVTVPTNTYMGQFENFVRRGRSIIPPTEISPISQNDHQTGHYVSNCAHPSYGLYNTMNYMPNYNSSLLYNNCPVLNEHITCGQRVPVNPSCDYNGNCESFFSNGCGIRDTSADYVVHVERLSNVNAQNAHVPFTQIPPLIPDVPGYIHLKPTFRQKKDMIKRKSEKRIRSRSNTPLACKTQRNHDRERVNTNLKSSEQTSVTCQSDKQLMKLHYIKQRSQPQGRKPNSVLVNRRKYHKYKRQYVKMKCTTRSLEKESFEISDANSAIHQQSNNTQAESVDDGYISSKSPSSDIMDVECDRTISEDVQIKSTNIVNCENVIHCHREIDGLIVEEDSLNYNSYSSYCEDDTQATKMCANDTRIAYDNNAIANPSCTSLEVIDIEEDDSNGERENIEVINGNGEICENNTGKTGDLLAQILESVGIPIADNNDHETVDVCTDKGDSTVSESAFLEDGVNYPIDLTPSESSITSTVVSEPEDTNTEHVDGCNSATTQTLDLTLATSNNPIIPSTNTGISNTKSPSKYLSKKHKILEAVRNDESLQFLNINKTRITNDIQDGTNTNYHQRRGLRVKDVQNKNTLTSVPVSNNSTSRILDKPNELHGVGNSEANDLISDAVVHIISPPVPQVLPRNASITQTSPEPPLPTLPISSELILSQIANKRTSKPPSEKVVASIDDRGEFINCEREEITEKNHNMSENTLHTDNVSHKIDSNFSNLSKEEINTYNVLQSLKYHLHHAGDFEDRPLYIDERPADERTQTDVYRHNESRDNTEFLKQHQPDTHSDKDIVDETPTVRDVVPLCDIDTLCRKVEHSLTKIKNDHKSLRELKHDIKCMLTDVSRYITTSNHDKWSRKLRRRKPRHDSSVVISNLRRDNSRDRVSIRCYKAGKLSRNVVKVNFEYGIQKKKREETQRDYSSDNGNTSANKKHFNENTYDHDGYDSDRTCLAKSNKVSIRNIEQIESLQPYSLSVDGIELCEATDLTDANMSELDDFESTDTTVRSSYIVDGLCDTSNVELNDKNDSDNTLSPLTGTTNKLKTTSVNSTCLEAPDNDSCGLTQTVTSDHRNMLNPRDIQMNTSESVSNNSTWSLDTHTNEGYGLSAVNEAAEIDPASELRDPSLVADVRSDLSRTNPGTETGLTPNDPVNGISDLVIDLSYPDNDEPGEPIGVLNDPQHVRDDDVDNRNLVINLSDSEHVDPYNDPSNHGDDTDEPHNASDDDADSDNLVIDLSDPDNVELDNLSNDVNEHNNDLIIDLSYHSDLEDSNNDVVGEHE